MKASRLLYGDMKLTRTPPPKKKNKEFSRGDGFRMSPRTYPGTPALHHRHLNPTKTVILWTKIENC